jgi:hypothetical protein
MPRCGDARPIGYTFKDISVGSHSACLTLFLDELSNLLASTCFDPCTEEKGFLWLRPQARFNDVAALA